jgi:CBS domain-containing protein
MHEIKHYMEKRIVATEGETTATETAKIMSQEKVHSVVVRNEKEYTGIVTAYDLIRKVLAKDLDPRTTAIAEVMSSGLITMRPDQSMSEALICMYKNNIRHLPVQDGDDIIGMISVKDFAGYFNQRYGEGDPLVEFWKKYDTLLETNTFRHEIKKLLENYRKKLDSTSLTAEAIDAGEAWTKISKYAKIEGYNDLAEVLGFAIQGD